MHRCTYLFSLATLLVVLLVAAPRSFSILAANKSNGACAAAQRGDGEPMARAGAPSHENARDEAASIRAGTSSGVPAPTMGEAAPKHLSPIPAAPLPAPYPSPAAYPSPAPYPYPAAAPAGPEPLATLLILLLFLLAAAALALRRRA